jgi:hypothetical protein
LLGVSIPSISFAAGDGTSGSTELDGATGTQTDSINVNGTGDLVLGAEGSANADAITFNGSASALTQTINVTDSAAAY